MYKIVELEKTIKTCGKKGPHDRGSEFYVIILHIINASNNNEFTMEAGVTIDQSCCETPNVVFVSDEEIIKLDDDTVLPEKKKVNINFDTYLHTYLECDNNILSETAELSFVFYSGEKQICRLMACNHHNGYYPRDGYLKDIDDNYIYESL